MHKNKRIDLKDVLVLIAASVAGLALGAHDGWAEPVTRERVMEHLLAMAVTWTYAIFVLSLTRYRTDLSRMACRPGFSAVVAVMTVWGMNIIYESLIIIGPASPDHHTLASVAEWFWFLFNELFWFGPVTNSPAGIVAAVWVVTAMAGCWRPEKSWIDRIGRALGVFWILAMVVDRVGCLMLGN
jgi:uncharacterized membrane protein YfcA